MIGNFLKKVFGTKSQRDIKKIQYLVDKANSFESDMEKFSDTQLKEKTEEFKIKIKSVTDPLQIKINEYKKQKDYDDNILASMKKDLKKNKEDVLMEILPEAFAVVREVGKRVLKMRHFDVQLMGGITLHQGKISEMTTGEGKTLVATLPAYLNGLTGKGAHVVTVNDYLAKRDRDWMGPLYEFLGLSVGVIVHDMNPEERTEAYNCDITYGTNNEFGFDYLRDNMVVDADERVQRPLNYCIVDEVDSILIDEARTPLIISGPVDTVSHCYMEVKSQVRDLVNKQTVLVDKFMRDLEKMLKEEENEEDKKILKEKDEEVCKLLYLIHRGAPKHKLFVKMIINNPAIKKRLESTTLLFGSKDMVKDRLKLEEKVYYIFEEKSREVVLTTNGEEELSQQYPGQFELEDITAIISDIQGDESLDDAQKAEKETAFYSGYEGKSKRIRSFEQLLKAYVLFQIDVDYVIDDNKVVIVDEFTGRMMQGRRFSDGLHEALEAKENVKIQKESQTLASITFQNYFRMYEKLSGMTGTADTEAKEFHEIYKLDVIVIPTNKPMRRTSHPDVIYKTEKEKFSAIAQEVEDLIKAGRPVLVGTVSIEKSEALSAMLKRKRIIHEVLNAKNHEREADIITLAGQKNAVTIATNMAGRGTDIVLGDGIIDRGGLHVIGTERHESRRVDNQLRGRAGRQGDPGSSRFYLSLEDDLMRIFGSDRIANVMGRLGLEDGQDIQHPLITRAIETAQKRVENHNFEIRKWVLKYDDVMNKQREVIYGYRELILEEEDLKDYVFDAAYSVIEDLAESFFNLGEEDDSVNFEEMSQVLFETSRVLIPVSELEGKEQDTLVEFIIDKLEAEYDKKKSLADDKEMFAQYLRWKLLDVVDTRWKDHLYAMDELRESVGLRAFGQRDPLIEFQHEGHKMFVEMMMQIKTDSVRDIFGMPVIHVGNDLMNSGNFNITDFSHPDFNSQDFMPESSGSKEYQGQEVYEKRKPYQRVEEKVGRNEPCSCGSGKKYKKCCGR